MKEIRIPHQKISNSQTITPVMEGAFRENGVDLHTHEVTKIDDDYNKGERVLQVKNTMYFTVPKLPWKR